MTTHDAYLAAMVRRWHVNPQLNQSGQTIGHHGAAAAILAHALWPGDADVLWACIAHDLGESVTGDVPSPAKIANPELALMLTSIEAAALDGMGIRYQPSDRLDLVDRLEAYLWMMHHAASQRLTPEWRKGLAWIEGMAIEQGVGVANAVQVILSDARKSAGLADVAPVKRGWWQRVCERFKTARTPPHERPGQIGFSSTSARSTYACNQAWREGALANSMDANPYPPGWIEYERWKDGLALKKGKAEMTVRPWKPSPTKARKAAAVENVTLAQPEAAPTPERQAKGMRAGPTMWRDDCQTPLHRARRYRHITESMFESGEEYIALRRAAMAVRGCASGRDSLDFTRYGESESGPEYAARIEQRDTKCGRVLGPLRGAAESFLIDEWQPQRGFDLKYVWWQDARAALIVLEVFFKGANA